MIILCSCYIIVETTDIEDAVPYNEEELAALYPNPQLDANEQFIDYFIKVSETPCCLRDSNNFTVTMCWDFNTQASQQDQHELYKLLMTYLKQRQFLVVLQCQVEVSQCLFSNCVHVDTQGSHCPLLYMLLHELSKLSICIVLYFLLVMSCRNLSC